MDEISKINRKIKDRNNHFYKGLQKRCLRGNCAGKEI